VEFGSQRLIPTDERSGLLTRIATTESVSSSGADEKLTAFLELESVIVLPQSKKTPKRKIVLAEEEVGARV
jgi:hypothetical protein